MGRSDKLTPRWTRADGPSSKCRLINGKIDDEAERPQCPHRKSRVGDQGVDDLEIKVGDAVSAITKSSDVIIGK